MAQTRVNPTRMELTRLKRSLATAVRGHKLLKDKRDEMMRQFIGLIRKNKELREDVERELQSALKGFVIARGTMPAETLEEAILYPARQINVEAGLQNVMSVEVPKLQLQELGEESGALPYGFAFTSAELDGAIATMAEILPKMLQLAEIEKSCNRLADEIEKTRRRVNALEYVMIPQMEENIRYITMKLDENERGSLTRLMKVKSMIAQRQEASV